MSENQKRLAKDHGTPAEFARAVWRAVPEFLSWGEAEAAIRKYGNEWSDAA